MIHQLNPSKRLTAIAKYITDDSIFADIGSDHAYLPCFVCLNNPSIQAIAGEVQKGPYENAKKNVNKHALSNQIDVRLGNGLEIITSKDHIDTIVLAGMGGQLIIDILQSGKEKLRTIDTIITQPNTNLQLVRQYLNVVGYHLTKEHIMKENGIIYEILVAKQSAADPYFYHDEKEFYFGPFLFQEQPKLFLEMWQQELLHLERIHKQIKQAIEIDTEKLAEIEKKINWIKEDVL